MLSFLVITQYGIRFVYLLEFFSAAAFLVEVWMILFCKLLVSFLYILFCGIPVYTKYFIVIFSHSYPLCKLFRPERQMLEYLFFNLSFFLLHFFPSFYLFCCQFAVSLFKVTESRF